MKKEGFDAAEDDTMEENKTKDNMKETIRIRTAAPDDAEKLLAVYAPYVRETAITFEYDVPSEAEFARRIAETLKRYPYLVAEEIQGEMPGTVLGYAYAGPFHARPAYDWVVETSIYVDRSRKHCGVGRKLYDALEEKLGKMGILNLNACIAVPSEGETAEDLDMVSVSAQSPDTAKTALEANPRIDRNSMEFHAHLGYRLVGEFTKCGYKFGTWYNMVWMEKLIGEHRPDQPPVIPFPELSC